MVKVTLKAMLTNIQNMQPPGTRNKPTARLSSSYALPVPPTPLLILAPDDRRGKDQHPSEQPTHFLFLPT
jgi:hypothetical protein